MGDCARQDPGGDPPDPVLHQVVGGAGRDGGQDPGRGHGPPHHHGAPSAGAALQGHEETHA